MSTETQTVAPTTEHTTPNAITTLIQEVARNKSMAKAVCDAIDYFGGQSSDPIPATIAAMAQDDLAFAASLDGMGNLLFDIAEQARIERIAREIPDDPQPKPASVIGSIPTFLKRFLAGEGHESDALSVAREYEHKPKAMMRDAIQEAVAALTPDDQMYLHLRGPFGELIKLLADQAMIHLIAREISGDPQPLATGDAEYRRGYVNGSIEPGVPYTGIIGPVLAGQIDDTDAPFPPGVEAYDRYWLSLNLDPSIANDGGKDAIEMVADNPKIQKQVGVAFDPSEYLGKRVRVILGDYFHDDTESRVIQEIALI